VFTHKEFGTYNQDKYITDLHKIYRGYLFVERCNYIVTGILFIHNKLIQSTKINFFLKLSLSRYLKIITILIAEKPFSAHIVSLNVRNFYNAYIFYLFSSFDLLLLRKDSQ